MSDALAGGDDAAARAEAEELLAAVEAAIDSGDVPAALAGELRGAAERLLGLIPNAAPAPPAKPDEGKPEKHEKKPKKPKKPKPGEETDTTGTTEPTDTTGTTTEGG